MMDYDVAVAIDSSQSFGRQGLNALGHSKHDKVKTKNMSTNKVEPADGACHGQK
jgi:hypothetical protein